MVRYVDYDYPRNAVSVNSYHSNHSIMAYKLSRSIAESNINENLSSSGNRDSMMREKENRRYQTKRN